jgi:hypothetical protein
MLLWRGEMKVFVQAVLGLGFRLVAWTALPQTAHADKAPDCMQSDTRGLPEGRLQEWWDKRTPEQQKYIRELPPTRGCSIPGRPMPARTRAWT